MAQRKPESTQFRMTPLRNFASMVDEFKELVCQNGQILVRGRSFTPPCIIEEIKNDRENHPAKKARLDSFMGEFPLLGLADHDELDKHESFQSQVPDRNDCNVLVENKNLMESHVVPVYEEGDLHSRKASKFVAEYLCGSSLQQWQASAPLNSSIVNQSQTLVPMSGFPTSRLQQVDSRPDKHSGVRNFSLFSKPPSVYKAEAITVGTKSRSTTLEGLKTNNEKKPPASGSNPMESAPLDMKSTKPISKPPAEPPTDEQSEAAVVPKDVNANTKSCLNKLLGPSLRSLEEIKMERKSRDDQVGATTSICSLGASNDPTYFLRRRYEDTEGLACPSDQNDEEEQVDATKTVSARGNTGAKRKRVKDVHNLSERKRRDKINKKIRALKDLLPSSRNVDKASILDEAIDYLKALQLQVQIMSMGSGAYAVLQMMLPTAIQNLYAPHFSPMGMGMEMGMGTRMHMAVPFSTSPVIGQGHMAVPLTMSQTPLINPLTGRMHTNTENVLATNLPSSTQAGKESF